MYRTVRTEPVHEFEECEGKSAPAQQNDVKSTVFRVYTAACIPATEVRASGKDAI